MTKLKNVETVEALIAYLKEKGGNHNNFYHYTTWGALQQILQSNTFLLTRGNSMRINDQQEAHMKGSWKEWNKTFIGSFSFGASENMAMWGLYGLPWEDAVRISIPNDKMINWIKSINQIELFSNGKAFPYHGDYDVSLTDVIYIGGQKSLQLTHYMTNSPISEEHPLHDIDKDIRMTGFIKNYAWHYENEVRIRIRLSRDTNYEKIRISIPKEVVEAITVTTGPCFNRTDNELYPELLEKEMITVSSFTDLVRYKTLCSMCRHGSFERI